MDSLCGSGSLPPLCLGPTWSPLFPHQWAVAWHVESPLWVWVFLLKLCPLPCEEGQTLLCSARPPHSRSAPGVVRTHCSGSDRLSCHIWEPSGRMEIKRKPEKKLH